MGKYWRFRCLYRILIHCQPVVGTRLIKSVHLLFRLNIFRVLMILFFDQYAKGARVKGLC